MDSSGDRSRQEAALARGEGGINAEASMYDRVWFWRKWLGDRKGHRCRIVARGTMNSCLIEFEDDGYRVITSRYAVRKA